MAQENEIIYVDNDGDVNNTNDPITQISLASTSVTAYSRLFQGNNRNSSSYSNELRLLQANIKSGTNSSVRNQRSEKAVTAPSCSHDNSKIKDASQPAASYSHCPAQAATDCPICMEPYAFGGDSGRRCIVTPCGHVFCHTCITQFIASNKKSNCPTCRAPFGKKIKSQLVTLFDVKVCAVDNMELERISKLLEQERKRYALLESTYEAKVASLLQSLIRAQDLLKASQTQLQTEMLMQSNSFANTHTLAANKQARTSQPLSFVEILYREEVVEARCVCLVRHECANAGSVSHTLLVSCRLSTSVHLATSSSSSSSSRTYGVMQLQLGVHCFGSSDEPTLHPSPIPGSAYEVSPGDRYFCHTDRPVIHLSADRFGRRVCVITAGGDCAQVYSVCGGRLLCILRLTEGAGTCAAYSPSGSRLWVGGSGGRVYVYLLPVHVNILQYQRTDDIESASEPSKPSILLPTHVFRLQPHSNSNSTRRPQPPLQSICVVSHSVTDNNSNHPDISSCNSATNNESCTSLKKRCRTHVECQTYDLVVVVHAHTLYVLDTSTVRALGAGQDTSGSCSEHTSVSNCAVAIVEDFYQIDSSNNRFTDEAISRQFGGDSDFQPLLIDGLAPSGVYDVQSLSLSGFPDRPGIMLATRGGHINKSCFNSNYSQAQAAHDSSQAEVLLVLLQSVAHKLTQCTDHRQNSQQELNRSRARWQGVPLPAPAQDFAPVSTSVLPQGVQLTVPTEEPAVVAPVTWQSYCRLSGHQADVSYCPRPCIIHPSFSPSSHHFEPLSVSSEPVIITISDGNAGGARLWVSNRDASMANSPSTLPMPRFQTSHTFKMTEVALTLPMHSDPPLSSEFDITATTLPLTLCGFTVEDPRVTVLSASTQLDQGSGSGHLNQSLRYPSSVHSRAELTSRYLETESHAITQSIVLVSCSADHLSVYRVRIF